MISPGNEQVTICSYERSGVKKKLLLFRLIDKKSDLDKVRQWTQAWDDIVDFEIVPVLTWREFWVRLGG
jgi:hypothetical protein